MSTRAVRLLVVDDHRLFRQGIVRLLRSSEKILVVGECSSGLEAIEAYQELRPDITLMDVVMPEVDGIEALRRIRAIDPDAKVVMLTMSDDDEHLMGAIQSGAAGYILKDIDFDALVSSIVGAAAGEAALSRTLTARVLAQVSAAPNRSFGQIEAAVNHSLSEREQEILACLARGLSNKQIAREIALSEHTVRTHVANIFGKLELENRVQAATYAILNGLD